MTGKKDNMFQKNDSPRDETATRGGSENSEKKG